METLKLEEFTNRHGDKVKVLLQRDLVGGHHLIVKAKRLREEEEHRMSGNELVTFPIRKFTEESTHTNFGDFHSDETLALCEFHLELFMNSKPDYTNEKLQEDLKALKEGKK